MFKCTFNKCGNHKRVRNSSLFNEFVCKLGLFWHAWTILKREWNEPTSAKKGPIYTRTSWIQRFFVLFLFDEPLKDSKSLKTFKISLTFRFDKLWHLSKSVHIGENSQILTVSNKKNRKTALKIMKFTKFYKWNCG
jgi:hypothetical protein